MQVRCASVDEERKLNESELVVGVMADVLGPRATQHVDDDPVDGFVELDHHERRAEALLIEIRKEVAREAFARVDRHVPNVLEIGVELKLNFFALETLLQES